MVFVLERILRCHLDPFPYVILCPWVGIEPVNVMKYITPAIISPYLGKYFLNVIKILNELNLRQGDYLSEPDLITWTL